MRTDRLLQVAGTVCGLVLVGAGVLATESRRDQLLPLERAALERQEPSVQRQLTVLREQLDALLADPAVSDQALADAFGRLGRLYFLYDIVDLATVALENAKLLAPEDYRWPYFLAVHFGYEGELEATEANLRRALELRPDDGPTLVRLANTLLDRGEQEEAEPLYQKVVERPAQRAAALAGLARIAQARGEHERAIELAREALELEPQADSLYYVIGMSYRALGDRDQAVAAIRKNKHGRVKFGDPLVESLSQENASAEAYFQAASDAMRRSDFESALTLYQSFLQVGGTREPEAYHNMGIALLSLDRWDEGIAALRKAVELKPDYRGGHFSLGSALADLGRYEEALPHYEKAHELDPDEPAIHADWATLLAKLGRVDESVRELRGMLAEDPLDAYARLKLGTVLASAGRAQEARKELTEIAESGGLADRHRAEAFYHLGMLAIGDGDLATARRDFESAVALDPKSPEAQRAWGEELARQGRFSEAADALEIAVELDPSVERSHMSRALALLLAERYARAEAAIEESVALFPQSVALRHVLARLLAACPEDSVRDGTRALELAEGVMSAQRSLDHAETLAMALAEVGRFDEAVRLQQQLVAAARQRSAPAGVVESLERRLAGYRHGRAARAPWLG